MSGLSSTRNTNIRSKSSFDRLVNNDDALGRISQSVEQALDISEGVILVLDVDEKEEHL